MRTNVPVAPGSSEDSDDRRQLLDHELARRDRIAVRVARRVAELGGDQVLELLGEHVLEHLGLGVHAIPRDPEALGQVELEQPVVADDLERHLLPTLGQPHALVGLVRHQLELAELAHHPRRGGGRDAEALGDRGRGDRARAARLERVDRLRVVLDGGGDGWVTDWHDRDYGMPKSKLPIVQTLAQPRHTRRRSRPPRDRRSRRAPARRPPPPSRARPRARARPAAAA